MLLHVRDPHDSGSWGYCPWLMLTGTYCPACGGLRAVNDLTRGDVAGAASSNLVFVASLPLLAAWWLRSMLDGWRGVARPVSARRVVTACVLFGVVARGVLGAPQPVVRRLAGALTSEAWVLAPTARCASSPMGPARADSAHHIRSSRPSMAR